MHAQQVPRRLLADAPGAGQPVRRVAAQRDEVGHLLGLDPVAPAHAVGIHELGAVLARPGRKDTDTASPTHWGSSAAGGAQGRGAGLVGGDDLPVDHRGQGIDMLGEAPELGVLGGLVPPCRRHQAGGGGADVGQGAHAVELGLETPPRVFRPGSRGDSGGWV